MLPKSFNEHGVLDQDYEATLTELRESLLVKGPDPALPNWDRPWRETLVDNLEILVRQLWAAGITKIHINGSFVTAKGHPGDIDGCFECNLEDYHTGRLENRLNQNAPKRIWAWDIKSRTHVAGFLTPKLPMWRSYRVELYAYSPEWANGVWDEGGNFRPFPDAYRVTRTGARKGIVQIKQD